MALQYTGEFEASIRWIFLHGREHVYLLFSIYGFAREIKFSREQTNQ